MADVKIVQFRYSIAGPGLTSGGRDYVDRCHAETTVGVVVAELDRLRRPFRNVDDMDWEHLFNMIPDSGHGKFWKSVLAEVRTALASKE